MGAGWLRPTVAVIGVGNPYRRDDGVGPAVLDLLRTRDLSPARDAAVSLVESDGETAGLIAAWEDRRLAILIDAVRAEPPHPGRVHRLLVPHPAAERARAASSHGMDLGDAVELAREIDRLPGRMVLFAIEAADTGYGPGLTPTVRAAAERVADEIEAEIGAEIAAERRARMAAS
jgi:hydrogenase maturation protease